jgi:hypothetical protein
VVRSICSVQTDSIGRPLDAVILEKVEIFSVGDPDPLPEVEHYEPKAPQFELREDILKDGKWGIQRPKRPEEGTDR